MKHIQKMNYGTGFAGYKVKIRRDGKTYQEYFSLNDYGSWKKAKQAAIKWRDEFLDEWDKYCNGKDETIQYQKTNTGYPGISVTYANAEKSSTEMKVNLPKGIGTTSRYISSEIGSKKYWKQYKKAFLELKSLVDEANRKRFGGRWALYKKRKGII